jgi:hypothetical protein
MVGKDVAGTNDHEMKANSQVRTPLGYVRDRPDAKENADFEAIPNY